MKICHDHWFMLLRQIESIGLLHLVAKSHDAMLEIVDHSLSGTHFTSAHFDPLLMAHYRIWEDEPNLDKCPLCSLEQDGGNVEQRIIGASNEALIEARRLNLAPSLQ